MFYWPCLEYIAEQLHPREEQDAKIIILDAVSVIEMNNTETVVFEREPMDWVFFNQLLDRQVEATPNSQGNYYEALSVADAII